MEVTSPLFDRLKESQDDSIPNVNSSDTVNESPGVPLSWFEARSRLKKVLEEYISEPPVQSRERRQPNPQNISRLERTLEWWLDCDMDLYLGSLLFSAMFFLQCMISLFRSKMENGGLYFTSTSLLSASIIFLLTSIISWRLLQRRRRSREEDGEVAKMRRLVSSFIHFLKSNEVRFAFGELTWAHEILIHRMLTNRTELNAKFLKLLANSTMQLFISKLIKDFIFTVFMG